MKRWLIGKIFQWFQERCIHESSWVRADILEGRGEAIEPGNDVRIQWCLRCGAYRVTNGLFGAWTHWEWRGPRAAWATEWKPSPSLKDVIED